MFGDATRLSNYLFTATAQGFWQPEQADLLRAVRAALLHRRRRRSPPAAAPPSPRPPAATPSPPHAVDADTLRLGEECLRDADPIPALRRKLADQLDDLARALRVRGGLAPDAARRRVRSGRHGGRSEASGRAPLRTTRGRAPRHAPRTAVPPFGSGHWTLRAR